MSPFGNFIWSELSVYLSGLPAKLPLAGSEQQQLLGAGYVLPPLHAFTPV